MAYKNPKRDRNYKNEAAIESPERRAQRAARMRARRKFEKENGDMPSSMHVDHKKPLSKGGAATDMKNLRAIPAKQNISYPRNSDGSMKTVKRKRS
jgi:hypothetical protein